jgi:predicted nucleic acid-binding protein
LIIYLDTSALVKAYVEEAGSAEVRALFEREDSLATGALTKAEMAAALSRAARLGYVSAESAQAAWQQFCRDWPTLVRIKVSEAILERAAALAWEYQLRGYDAMHLAAALSCQEFGDQSVMVASFDRELWRAAQAAGLAVWPE